MANLGHNVKVLTLKTPSAANLEHTDGVEIHRYPGWSPARSYHFPSPSLSGALSHRVDVIHVHNFHSVLPLVASPFVRNARRSLVTPHYHGLGHHLHSRIAWNLYHPLLKRAVQRYDVVHCVSEVEARRIRRDFGVEPVVLENGVDDMASRYTWENKTENLRVLFVGRLERYKRIDTIVESLSQLKATGYKPLLTIVGSGPERNVISLEAARRGLELEIFENLNREALFRLYTKCSCIVNCSLHEAYSLVTAEALAIGLPAVVVPPWGIIFDKVPRAHLAMPNPADIAAAILRTRTSSSSPRAHIPTWSEVAEKMCSLYLT
jgi:glycosyltransferase involved in cell wall biosynthesis